MSEPYVVPQAALDQHLAIVGRTGSGKTYAAKGFVERLLRDGRHVVIVDPTGVWWGLRATASGSPAFSVVVFGGDHADIPLGDHAGKLAAEAIIEQRVSCVVDVSEFSTAGRTRFMTAFLEALYTKSRAPLHLVLDEADTVAPQNPMADHKLLLNRTEQIVRRGRARGFRVMMITQRPAVLHKNVLSQAGTLIAMKLTSPQDRDALGSWIEGQADREIGRNILATLPQLQPGEGWVWFPEGEVLERTRFPAISTYDSSSTPEFGDVPASAPIMAPVELAALRALLAAPGPAAAKEPPAAAIEAALEQGRAEGRQEIIALQERVRLLTATINDAIGRLISAETTRQADGTREVAVPRPIVPPVIDATAAEPPPARRARPPARIAESGALPPAARKILDTLAARYPARFTWTQAATLSGLKATGGHFNAGRKALRDRGLIEEANDLIVARAAGDAKARAATGRDAIDDWCAVLPVPAPDMLRAIVGTGASGITTTQLAELLGKQPRGGHWNSGLSVLKQNDLITKSGDLIRATERLLA